MVSQVDDSRYLVVLYRGSPVKTQKRYAGQIQLRFHSARSPAITVTESEWKHGKETVFVPKDLAPKSQVLSNWSAYAYAAQKSN